MLLKSKKSKISHEEHLPLTLLLELHGEAVEAELTEHDVEQLPPNQTPLVIVYSAVTEDHEDLVEAFDYQQQRFTGSFMDLR